ncbi:hypothetical protein T02_14885 [Trichinella nativa]|uniref:Uncharacterized protein n=1 Tax=Trichinella nativa TaxID=6335 RepID=A0A0V1LC63_9BILA|nr:hypothetical protein T02_14885 [Trichinella nativa]
MYVVRKNIDNEKAFAPVDTFVNANRHALDVDLSKHILHKWSHQKIYKKNNCKIKLYLSNTYEQFSLPKELASNLINRKLCFFVHLKHVPK